MSQRNLRSSPKASCFFCANSSGGYNGRELEKLSNSTIEQLSDEAKGCWDLDILG